MRLHLEQVLTMFCLHWLLPSFSLMRKWRQLWHASPGDLQLWLMFSFSLQLCVTDSRSTATQSNEHLGHHRKYTALLENWVDSLKAVTDSYWPQHTESHITCFCHLALRGIINTKLYLESKLIAVSTTISYLTQLSPVEGFQWVRRLRDRFLLQAGATAGSC